SGQSFEKIYDVVWAGDHTGPLVGLAVARPDHIVDFLEALAGFRPAFDNLNAVKVARSRILHRPHRERRGLALRRWQIAAHRHALRITGLHPVRLRHHAGVVFPTTEQAHLNVRTAHTKGLSARHAIEDGSPRVFFR